MAPSLGMTMDQTGMSFVQVKAEFFPLFCDQNQFSSKTRASRKAAYRTAILFLHGRMGKGRRAVVPACIGRLNNYPNSHSIGKQFTFYTPSFLK